MGPNVAQDLVHAEKRRTSADAWKVIIGQGVEERDTLALLNDAGIGGGKEAVGQAIPKQQKLLWILFLASIFWRNSPEPV